MRQALLVVFICCRTLTTDEWQSHARFADLSVCQHIAGDRTSNSRRNLARDMPSCELDAGKECLAPGQPE